MSCISFDFDQTLTRETWHEKDGNWYRKVEPNLEMIQKLIDHAEEGYEIVVVTYRNGKHESEEWVQQFQPDRLTVKKFILDHNLPVTAIHFTDKGDKGPILKKIGAIIHYDDCPRAIQSAEKHGVKGVLVEF